MMTLAIVQSFIIGTLRNFGNTHFGVAWLACGDAGRATAASGLFQIYMISFMHMFPNPAARAQPTFKHDALKGARHQSDWTCLGVYGSLEVKGAMTGHINCCEVIPDASRFIFLQDDGLTPDKV